MPRVICSLPNAAGVISGVKFTALDDGRLISAEIDDALAERFTSIPGYELDDEDREDDAPQEPEPPKLTKRQQQAAEKAAKAAAEAEAKAAKEAEADQDTASGDDDNTEDEVF